LTAHDRQGRLTPQLPLSCQAIVDDEDLVIAIPKYSISQQAWIDEAR
jgi:hypothetical protein